MSRRYGAIIHPDELNMRWLERAHAAGINVLGLHPVGGVHADESLRAMIEDEFLPERRVLYARARELGMDIEYEMHALSYLLPRRMFNVHPDWFRMNEQGARVADFNFCPSNRDALEYISGRAALLAQVFPAHNRPVLLLAGRRARRGVPLSQMPRVHALRSTAYRGKRNAFGHTQCESTRQAGLHRI